MLFPAADKTPQIPTAGHHSGISADHASQSPSPDLSARRHTGILDILEVKSAWRFYSRAEVIHG